jgi:hypothetical protein
MLSRELQRHIQICIYVWFIRHPPHACRRRSAFAAVSTMPIPWNEIRHNAIKFSRDWTGAKSVSAEKQTFWNEFPKSSASPARRLPALKSR